jgi:hypothetical protein
METIRPAVPTATATPREALPYDTLGMDVRSVKEGILRHLEYTLAELPRHVDSEWEPYVALALTIHEQDVKRVYYLSLERPDHSGVRERHLGSPTGLSGPLILARLPPAATRVAARVRAARLPGGRVVGHRVESPGGVSLDDAPA